jgi:hypothetical protein
MNFQRVCPGKKIKSFGKINQVTGSWLLKILKNTGVLIQERN